MFHFKSNHEEKKWIKWVIPFKKVREGEINKYEHVCTLLYKLSHLLDKMLEVFAFLWTTEQIFRCFTTVCENCFISHLHWFNLCIGSIELHFTNPSWSCDTCVIVLLCCRHLCRFIQTSDNTNQYRCHIVDLDMRLLKENKIPSMSHSLYFT